MTSGLDAESAFFDSHRAEWIEQGHVGEYAVVHGTTLLGFYADLGSAYRAGVDAFGPGRFLAKKVTPKDDVEIVQRVHLRGSQAH